MSFSIKNLLLKGSRTWQYYITAAPYHSSSKSSLWMWVLGQRKKILSFKTFSRSSASSNSPNHQEQALQQLYAGINQASGDSVTIYLKKIRSVAEDAYGLSTTWTVNQASLVLQKVVSGLRSKDLAQLTSSFVITLPFNYNMFRDVVVQFEMRLPSHPPAVHTINALRCYKGQGQHLVKDCTVV